MEQAVQQIKNDPDYRRLVKTRSKFGWALTWVMMAVYYGYILLIAFDKDLMSSKTGSGVMTLAMPFGLFVILFTVIITGIYVRRANKEFDQLTDSLRAKVKA